MSGPVLTDEEDVCPLCGTDVRLLIDYDYFGLQGKVLRTHLPRPGCVTHRSSPVCLGSGMTVDYAQQVADARAEHGGRLLTSAHP